MDNKQIQEARMRGYFIEATRNILKSEGLKSISVRNIAQQAGYSYATLYNYFKDVKELVFICVNDFLGEIEKKLKETAENARPGKERIKSFSMGYIRYFLEYPGIYELFYLERMSEISNNEEASQLIVSFLKKICQPDWEIIEPDSTKRQLKMDEMNYVVAGLLLFYFNRREPSSWDAFIKRSEEQIGNVLGGTRP
ncbi:MAG: TetR/AcrR family transcriptional regulator [Prolixibacteraceae bacterium]|nr:TetR/AcrR family transcriptional regulator [Prolixibacteraceae bacterium]